MATLSMTPFGVPTFALGQGSSAAYQASRPAGDQGKGWGITYATTYAVLPVANTTDVLLVPTNARDLSLTYGMTAAATAILSIQGTNNTPDEIKAGTATWGTYPAAVAPTVAGGSADSTTVTISLPAAPTAIRGVISGTGSAGADSIRIVASCCVVIRP